MKEMWCFYYFGCLTCLSSIYSFVNLAIDFSNVFGARDSIKWNIFRNIFLKIRCIQKLFNVQIINPSCSLTKLCVRNYGKKSLIWDSYKLESMLEYIQTRNTDKTPRARETQLSFKHFWANAIYSPRRLESLWLAKQTSMLSTGIFVN